MRAAKRPDGAQELMSMTLHSLSGAWPISKPVQRLAGIRRLERNARRWRLRISRWIYEVTGPRYALRCFDTHVETRSPPISLQRKNYPIDGGGDGEVQPRCSLSEMVQDFARVGDHRVRAPGR